MPDRIVAWNAAGSPQSGNPLNMPGTKRLVAMIDASFNIETKKTLSSAALVELDDKTQAPAVFFNMNSFTLDMPMRLEIPMRAVLKGGQDLKGKYVIYLHALLADDGNDYLYYGITKRGWNRRFLEHTNSALNEETRRLFPQKLEELIRGQGEKRMGNLSAVGLKGLVTCLLSVGLDEDAAMDAEEYLVDKYSLASRHLHGLNMIPGGREGVRRLHELVGKSAGGVDDTDEREGILDRYLVAHPSLGVPKPGVALKWNDPAYAEAVICGRENRLSADQVREIRYLAAMGTGLDSIRQQTDAIDTAQEQRVLEGRTYIRIK
ncbi:MAG: hypothetical protein AAB403_07475 [Planctomycetota bacterium]